MSGENRNINSPLNRKSARSTPEDINLAFNSNQFWSYPFHNTEDLIKNMNSSSVKTNSRTVTTVNDNDVKPLESTVPTSDDQNVTNSVVTVLTCNGNVNKPKENAPSTTKTVTVPKNFNSLNELTEEELQILIEERRKAAAEAEINVISNLKDVEISSRKPNHTNSEYLGNTKGSSRRVSETLAKKQDSQSETRRKSLPSSKNFLHGLLQNFIMAASQKEALASNDDVDSLNSRKSPNVNQENVINHVNINLRQSPGVKQENLIDLTLKHAALSPDEEVQAINAGVHSLQMEISPDREETNNASVNRTPVASISSYRTNGNKTSKNVTGTPKSKSTDESSNLKTGSIATPSPELQYPTEKDFGYVSPIPVNEKLSSTYSDSPKVSCQSPILSCSFTDPTYQYVSDTSDTGDDSSFERDFEPDLMSFEDPALEKSPFIKYSVELRAKLAARVSRDGPYKPSPFLFSPRSSSGSKVYTSANDRNLHLLQEETSLDFDKTGLEDLIPEEQNDIDVLLEELKIEGEVTDANEDENLSKCSETKETKDSQVAVAEMSVSKKTVWSQLVENIEMHIIKGNKAGFIATLNSHGHTLQCV